MTLSINEIFHSIQGESGYMGFPCVFVRLAYCNLRCMWCDTAYAFHEGTEMSLDEILRRIEGYECRLVEVTGGEPLAQPAVHALMTMLCDKGYTVLLETGGSLDISRVDPRVKRIMDIKCPGSGMEARNLWSNVRYLTASDEVKFVIRDRTDFDWAIATVREHSLDKRCPILMSVVFGELQPVELARWILDSGVPARFQLQMHKYIWEPETRGV